MSISKIGGIPRDDMLAVSKEFAKQFNLPLLNFNVGGIAESQNMMQTRSLIKKSTPPKSYKLLKIHGGIQDLHLHINNDIYLMNKEQWAKYSKLIIANARAKLSKVNKISFEEGVMIADAVERLH